MAQLPPDGEYLMQQIGGQVVLYHRYTEEELVRFDGSNPDATARAQFAIHNLEELNVEQKCFAHFWSGYFHAHNGGELAVRLEAPFPMFNGSTEAEVAKRDRGVTNQVTGNVTGSVVQTGDIEGGLQL